MLRLLAAMSCILSIRQALCFPMHTSPGYRLMRIRRLLTGFTHKTKSALISPEFVLTYEPYITEVGEEVVVTVSVREMVDLYSFRMDIEFDQELLEFRKLYSMKSLMSWDLFCCMMTIRTPGP